MSQFMVCEKNTVPEHTQVIDYLNPIGSLK